MTGGGNLESGEEYASRNDDFRSAISELSTGGALLVVSEGAPGLHDRCCRQLLGTPDTRRLRVLGVAETRTASDPWEVIDRLPGGVDVTPDELRVVYNDLPTRGTAAVDPDAGSAEVAAGAGPTRTPGDDVGQSAEVLTTLSNATLGAFGVAIDDAVESLLADVDGDPADGELRVCVEDVATLVDVDEPTTVAQFLHVLGSKVKAKGGLFHAHATLGIESEPIRTFAPFVDSIVHLRVRDGEEEMRWIVSDGPASDWFPIDWIRPRDGHS